MAVEITPKVKKATVTFKTPARESAEQAVLTGDWNNWEAIEMKKNSDGTFSVKANINLGKSYQFGYSIDGIWTTDSDLPFAASPFGTENSILDLINVVAAKKVVTKKLVDEKVMAKKVVPEKATAAAEKKKAPKRKPPVKKR